VLSRLRGANFSGGRRNVQDTVDSAQRACTAAESPPGPSLRAAAEAAVGFMSASGAAATYRACASDLREFESWSSARTVITLPAALAAVAAYLSWMAAWEPPAKPSTIRRRVVGATRLVINSVLLIALPVEFLLHGPGPSPHRRIFGSHRVFERVRPEQASGPAGSPNDVETTAPGTVYWGAAWPVVLFRLPSPNLLS
jgi:hypothetical protein